MIASYFESIKYVGHLWPVAFIRIIIGYQYLELVINRIQSGYFKHAYISERLNLSDSSPSLYFEIFKNLIQSHWLVMTSILIGFEFLIGLSYLLGFGVRIISILGMILSLHIFLFFEFQSSPGQIFLFYIHLLFFLIGAGRCLGIDYYFFKSRRGLLW
jgi:thiosulfate dehydrogenase (quinone) large subunit